MGAIDNKPPSQGGLPGPVSTGDASSPAQASPFMNILTSLETVLNAQINELEQQSQAGTAAVKDSFAGAAQQANFNSSVATAVSTPGSPVLRAAGIGGTGGATGLGNKWLQNLGQAVYLEAMRFVATIQSKMKLQEVLNIVKQTIANQSNVEAQAANIEQQALLEFVSAIIQAVVQIASACVAIGLAAKTAGSGASAKNQVQKETDALKENPKCTDTKKWIDDKHAYMKQEKKVEDMPKGERREAAELKLKEQKAKLDETEPGYQQFKDYLKENKIDVQTSETKTNNLNKPNENKINEKEDSGTLILTKENKTNAPDENKIKTTKENTTETKHDDGTITTTVKNPLYNGGKSSESDIKEKTDIAQQGEIKSRAQYDKQSDPNGEVFQGKVSQKIQTNNTMIQLINQVNQSLTNAVVGLVKATFDLMVAEKKETAVYIQASLDQAKSLIDLANQMHSSEAQNLDTIYSSMTNTLQMFGQINKYGG